MFPVLIIGYERKENILRLISQCIENGIRQLYLSLDGPKNSRVLHIQSEIAEEIGNLDLPYDVRIHLRLLTKNMGIAVHVLTSIEWAFENESELCILEDDLVLSQSFFPYVDISLKTYEDVDTIYMISGNNFVPLEKDDFSTIFTSYSQTWGWATWRSKWELIRTLAYQKPKKAFSVNKVSNFWHYGTNRVLLGHIDTWDIPVANLMHNRKLLCVLPPRNLSTNIGFDDASTHTKTKKFPLDFPFYEIELSKIQFSNPDDMYLDFDRSLEKNVFNIPRRCSLLPLYSWVHQVFPKGTPLDVRLNNARSIEVERVDYGKTK